MSEDNFTTQDLTVLPPAKDKFNVKVKMKLDKRLFKAHKGVLALLIGQPASGKTTVILNLLGNFLKFYYENVHFIGPAFEHDPTLKELTQYYGNLHTSMANGVINGIIKQQSEMDLTEKTNCAIIIDDLMAQADFKSTNQTALGKLCSIHRHVLGGAIPTEDDPDIPKSGGLLLISNQRLFSSIPRNARACADVIILGKVANREEYGMFIKEYGLTFGGNDQLQEMINYTQSTPYSFLCLYLFGDLDPETGNEPVAYKNFSEKLYPSERWPAKELKI